MTEIHPRNPRIQTILTAIEQYASDAGSDYFNDGYDEGYSDGEAHTWDYARNKGYDEGWEDACQFILDKYISPVYMVNTPESTEDLHEVFKVFQDNGAMCVSSMNNYLYKVIAEMKVNKDEERDDSYNDGMPCDVSCD